MRRELLKIGAGREVWAYWRMALEMSLAGMSALMESGNARVDGESEAISGNSLICYNAWINSWKLSKNQTM